MPERNHLHQSVLLALALPAALYLCGFIPAFEWMGHTFKTIDVFADIRPDTTATAVADTLPDAPMDTVLLPLPDSCPPGYVCIEDYSPDRRMMAAFFAGLQSAQQGRSVCRVAFFGDSFIEGDLMTADLRDTLQRAFGGYGVGFVPITSEAAAFRASIGHRYTGFESFSIVHHRGKPFAAGGYCTLPREGNRVTYTARPGRAQWSVFPQIRLFYRAVGNVAACRYSLDGRPDTTLALRSTGRLEAETVAGAQATSAAFGFPVTDSLQLYGVSFESRSGVIVDNFALRGHSGMGLSLISDAMHRRFDSLQQYRLIVLQFGLNITDAKIVDYNWYVPRMVSVINQIKADYPGASILLMGVPDRSMNQNGTYTTMPGIPALIAVQRRIASETGIAFWDTYSAMGGKNSMVDWVAQSPPLANKDYTHLNNRGAKKIAQLFSQTLFFQYEAYLQAPSAPR
jgi:hypothetical protein